jgi:hypothetical protein
VIEEGKKMGATLPGILEWARVFVCTHFILLACAMCSQIGRERRAAAVCALYASASTSAMPTAKQSPQPLSLPPCDFLFVKQRGKRTLQHLGKRGDQARGQGPPQRQCQLQNVRRTIQRGLTDAVVVW